MNLEQAVFHAAVAADKARLLLSDIWKGATGDGAAEVMRLDREKCLGLVREARVLLHHAELLEKESRP